MFAVAVLCAGDARAEVRRLAFPPAFNPDTFNNVRVHPSAPVAFVASRETDTVFAFDPRSGAVLGWVEAGDGPLFISLTEREGRSLAAVTCAGTLGAPRPHVAVLDVTDPARMSVVARAHFPEGYGYLFAYRSATFTPDGAALVVAASESETARGLLLTYDVVSGEELGRVPIGFAPSFTAVVARADRTLVAVAHATGPRGRVTVVDVTDPAAPRVHARAALPRGSSLFSSNDIAIGADGRTAYVASGDGNAVYALDLDTGRVLSRTPSGLFPTNVVGFEQDGAPRLLVLAEVSASVLLYDVADPATPRLLTQYRAPATLLDAPPVVSADGRTAYATAVDGDRVYSVDLATGDLNYLISAGESPSSTAVWNGADGQYVCVYGAGSRDVTCLRAGPVGFQLAGRFAGPAGAVKFGVQQNLALTADGRYAFAASRETGELLAVDVERAELAGRVHVGLRPSQIALAEDPGSGRRRVAVVGAGDSSVTFVDASDPARMVVTGAARLEAAAPFFLSYTTVAFTGDGGTVFVADGVQFVYAIDAAAAQVVGAIGAGFNPVTIAMREEAGQRRLAVLSASNDGPALTVLDATSPAAMTRVASFEMPRGTVAALNNVPRFTADGRHVVVGASLSDDLFVVDAATGALSGALAGTDAVRPATFSEGGVQKFAAVNLGSAPTRLYRLRRSGAPREAASLGNVEGGYFVVANDATVDPDGAVGFVPNYGRGSLLTFDPRTGALTGELPLGAGPGQAAIDRGGGRVVAIEINGTSSSVLVADLAEVGPPPASGRPARAGASREASGLRTAAPDAAGPEPGRAGPATFSTPQRRVVTWERRSRRR
jgi:DNA-binding beta-propeller fold protein YncE